MIAIPASWVRHLVRLGAMMALSLTACGPAAIKRPSTPADESHAAQVTIADIKNEREFVIRDERGAPLTENEFVRRYDDATGSSQLAGLDRWRNPASVWISSLLVLSGAGLLALGIWEAGSLPSGGGDGVSLFDARVEKELIAYALGSMGAVTAAGGGAWLGWELLSSARDGDPQYDHYLSASRTRAYVDYYNRLMFEKSRDQNSGAPNGARLSPIVSPTFVGVGGRF